MVKIHFLIDKDAVIINYVFLRNLYVHEGPGMPSFRFINF